MSFPLGVSLFSPQSPVYQPPFTIWLTPSNKWQVIQPNGVYAPVGDLLYFFPQPNNPYIATEPGPGASPLVTAANFPLGSPVTGSFVGMPLFIAFDQQAY